MAILGPFIPSKGLNTLSPVMTLPKDQASVLTNAYPIQRSVTNFGNLTKLNASALNSGKLIAGLGYYVDPAQAITSAVHRRPIIIAIVADASAGKIYSGPYDSSAITFTDVTGTSVLAATPNPLYSFDTLNGIFIGAGGAENARNVFQITAYNGNAADLAGSPPRADCVKVVNNIAFLAGQYGASSTFSTFNWSAVNDPQTWPAGSSLTFRNNDGDIITALAALGQNLLIFKRHSIGLLSTISQTVSGTVTLGPLTTISSYYGSLAVNCVKELPDGRVAFIDSRFHLIITDGSSFFDASNQPDGPNIRDLYKSEGTFLDFSQQINLILLPEKNQLWIHSQQVGIHVYDYVENSWSLSLLNMGGDFSRVIVNVPATSSDTRPSHTLLGTNGGFVWEADGSTGPTDTDGTTLQPTITQSIQLPVDFIPRTLLVPATLESGASITLTVGFNGIMNGSSSTQLGAANSALWNLFFIASNKTNVPRPLTMQVQIQVTAGKTFTIYPWYVSDEVLTNVS